MRLHFNCARARFLTFAPAITVPMTVKANVHAARKKPDTLIGSPRDPVAAATYVKNKAKPPIKPSSKHAAAAWSDGSIESSKNGFPGGLFRHGFV